MQKCREDARVATQNWSSGDCSESGESDGAVAEECAVFVAVAARKDTDAHCRSICCVADSTEIDLRRLSEI